MRKTNQQKWAELNEILEDKKEIIIDELFPDKKPTSVFTAYWNGIVQNEITHFMVRGSKEPHVYSGQKITGKDVEALKLYLDKFDSDSKQIFIYYGGVKYVGAYKLADIDIKKHRSFNREDLIEIHKELEEKYAPKDGYKPCQYCGKQVPENTLIKGTVIYRGGSKVGYYCSGECAGNDQMAHEG